MAGQLRAGEVLEGVGGVPVAARRVPGPSPLATIGNESYVEQRTRTDASGRYELELFAGSLYRITLGLPDLAVPDLLVQIAPPSSGAPLGASGILRGASGTTLALPDQTPSSGGILEIEYQKGGRGLPFANLWVVPLAPDSAGASRRQADLRGRAVLRGLCPGRYRICGTAPTLLTHAAPLLPPSGPTVTVSDGAVTTYVIRE